MTAKKNDIGLNGIEFIEFSSQDPIALKKLFESFGFSKRMVHQEKKIELYRQGEINVLLNMEPGSFSHSFNHAHGPCLSSMGWRTKDPKWAWSLACKRGASSIEQSDYKEIGEASLLGVKGIGGSNIYLTQDQDKEFYEKLGFVSVSFFMSDLFSKLSPNQKDEKLFCLFNFITILV